MRVLIVGAGAVGQVYGLFLRNGGADVSFYVKESHADEARAGFTLHRLGEGVQRVPLSGFGVLTTMDEVRAQRWDQLWLAVSGTAIRGAWLDEIVAATGDATVVCLQPGPEAKARVGPLAGDRFVVGLISFIAYQAPLPGEKRITIPGIAFWIPPSASPFCGPSERVGPVVETLRRGGCPAKEVASLDEATVFATPFLQVHVAALDSVGWSWPKVREGDTLALATRAFREAAAIGAKRLERSPPFWTRLVGPWMARLALWLAPRVLPLDVPTYFGYHFTKVGDQTRAHLDAWIEAGRAAGLPVDAIAELRGRLLPEAKFDPAVTLRA